jgi:hypothetical protein
VTDSTKFKADDIKKSADVIGGLLNDMSAFTKLKPHWPNAGSFELAQWLERIVDDRRNGIVAHAEHLKLTFEDMQTSLKKIATDFENADGENAKKIIAALDEMQGKISGDIGTLDQNTENSQHNFSGGGEKNNNDGDGYNDDTTAGFGATD